MVILMKFTSRERPEQLLETIRQYIEMANNFSEMVFCFSFDEDDYSYRNENFTYSVFNLLCNNEKSLIYFGNSAGKIDAINRDVEQFSKINHWDILLNISDDQRPIVKGYDDIIRNAMPSDLDASIWHTDGQNRVNTQEIIGRKYYERFNYIYNPSYKSLFCDNEATEVARILGKQIKDQRMIIKHYHPAWGSSESFKKDALYQRNDSFWEEDEATFNARKKINFGL